MTDSSLDIQHRLQLLDQLQEYEREHARLQGEIRATQVQLRALTVKEGRNSNDVFARLFKIQARRLLDRGQYDAIIKAAQQRLGWAERQIDGDDDEQT